jgi:hypothetical protein
VITHDEVRHAVSSPPGMDTCQTVSVPTAGRALGLGRNAAYEAARRGEIKTLRFGRLLRVSKAWLSRVLNQEEKCNGNSKERSNG